MRHLRTAGQRGMTLVELLVVIVIIGVMMGVLMKGLFSKGEAAKARLNQTSMEKLKGSIENYRLEYNTYPNQLEDLLRPGEQVRNSGKVFVAMVTEEELNDVWGYRFIYRAENNNRSYSLTSLGSDGVPGGEGGKQDVTLRP